MQKTIPYIGPSSQGGIVEAMDSVQASTIPLRDSNGDDTCNIMRAVKGLRTAGHLWLDYQAQSVDFSLDEATYNGCSYDISASGAARTVTLPAAASYTDKVVIFRKSDSTANSVTIEGNGSEITGYTSVLRLVLYRQFDTCILQSDGVGWIILSRPNVLAAAVAASTAITAASEGTFDTSGITIAADTLRAGEILEIEAQVILTATTGSETTNVKLKIGSTVIVATGALDVATSDIIHIRATICIRTVGGSGTMVATGIASIGTGGASSAIGALTAKPFFLASTTLDTTAANAINVTCTHSSTGESARLDVFTVKRF